MVWCGVGIQYKVRTVQPLPTHRSLGWAWECLRQSLQGRQAASRPLVSVGLSDDTALRVQFCSDSPIRRLSTLWVWRLASHMYDLEGLGERESCVLDKQHKFRRA